MRKSQLQYISRKDKHTKTTKLYVCECGKEYIGFTSLYLHFQKKHQGNISSKKECKNRKVKKINGKIIYTYYFSKGNYKPCNRNSSDPEIDVQSDESSSEIQSPSCIQVEGVTNLFIKSKCPLDGETSTTQKIIRQFSSFVKGLLSQKSQDEEIQFKIWQIPYFFNPFILQKKEMLNCSYENLDIKFACMALESYGRWLQEQGYTELNFDCNLKVKND